MTLSHSVIPLHPEIRGRDGFARQFARGTVQCDAAFLQAVDLARGFERLRDVLLDDDQRQAFGNNQPDADATRARGMFDFAADLAHPDTFGNRPCGRSARMARNAKWPASSCQPGSICAPIACDTPRITPPTSVPHILPSPPMMTASKPKISRAGPMAGSKLVRTAKKTPAMAMMANDSAIAIPNTWRVSRPINCATA